MDDTCYVLVIKEKTCQSGVPLTNERIFTNISDIDDITLSNGYILNVKQGTNNSLIITFLNNAFNINLEFKMVDSTPAVFDLPIQNGTYKVGVYLRVRSCCSNSCSCSCGG